MAHATLSYVYGAMLGFIHGARVSEEEGFRVDTLRRHRRGDLALLRRVLQARGRGHPVGQLRRLRKPAQDLVEATARLAQLARESGINAEFPTFVSGFFERAAAAGYGDEEAAALIKVLR